MTDLVAGAAARVALTLDGAGTQTLSGANSYTGNTTISAGTLQIGNGGTTGSLSTSSAIANNGTLIFHRSDNLAQGSDFSTAAITGSGNLVKRGAGTLTLNAANTYEGSTTLESGTLDVANTSALGTGELVQTDGSSTVEFSTAGTVANDMSVYNVAFTANGTTLSGTITNNNTTYDVGSGLTNTISGVLTGSGGVNKTGAGDLILTASNNFTGAVDVQGGLLDLASASGSAAGSTASVSVSPGLSSSSRRAVRSTTVPPFLCPGAPSSAAAG